MRLMLLALALLCATAQINKDLAKAIKDNNPALVNSTLVALLEPKCARMLLVDPFASRMPQSRSNPLAR